MDRLRRARKVRSWYIRRSSSAGSSALLNSGFLPALRWRIRSSGRAEPRLRRNAPAAPPTHAGAGRQPEMGRRVSLPAPALAPAEDECFLEWKLRHLAWGGVEPRDYLREGDSEARRETEATISTLAAADDPSALLAERVRSREALLEGMGLLERAERHVAAMLRARAQWARPNDFVHTMGIDVGGCQP